MIGVAGAGRSPADPPGKAPTRQVAPAPGLRAYQVVDVGSGGDEDSMDSAALNDTGIVALSVNRQAYLWQSGHRTRLASGAGTTDDEASTLTVGGINNQGDAVGGSSITQSGAITSTYGDAILWRGGKAISLGSLSGLSDASAAAINDHGQIVGNSSSASSLESQDTISGVTHAFLWEQGKMTDLGESTAADINSVGQIAGTLPFVEAEGDSITDSTHAALWTQGKWRDLGTLPGWTFSAATGISADGTVVGCCHNGLQPTPSEAFLWKSGRMRDLGPGQASGINAGGQIVGNSGGRAVLWWRGGLYDLNTCLRGAKGWVLTSAAAINDRGQIAGFGTSHGHPRAFLLSPLPPLRLSRTHAPPQTPQMHLVAAPTGSGKIILYWRGVQGAAGYNVYRGLASVSQQRRINIAPVRTPDPGVANGFTDTDRGLKNGVAYVYTVAAVSRRGQEIARSNPSQAVPDPDAPPWDSRSAAKIAAKIWANAQRVDFPDPNDSGPILPPQPSDFVAPDGVIYKDPIIPPPPSPYRYLLHPAAAYDTVDLGTLGRPFVTPRGLNNSGVAVGSAQPPRGDERPVLPFLWQNGTMQALPIPPSESPYGFATGINASGMICGTGNTSERRRAALVWQAGAVRVLPPLPGGREWNAHAINDAGQIAGESGDAQGRSHMVWWDEAGQLHDLGLGTLTGINATGQVAGTRSGGRGVTDHAVRSEGGVLHDLGTLGGPFSQAEAINRRGEVVGWSNIPHGSSRGFLYTKGRMINLSLPPSALSSHAGALNDAGSIVGGAETSSGPRALLWQRGTMADLNDLARLPSGVTLTEATAINDQGQICAVGRSANTSRAYLLTPRSAK